MMDMDLRNCFPILIVIACTLAAADARAADAGRETAKGDLARLQGTWKLVDYAYYENGIRAEVDVDRESARLTFTANGYHLKLKTPRQEVDDLYTIKLIPRTHPKAFDVIMPTGTLIEGIYELKGDTLRRCYSRADDPRPEGFQTGTQTYQKWQRVKEEPMPAAPR